MIGRNVVRTILALLVVCAGGRAHALDPARQISQYGHTAWRLSDGQLDGIPTAITQTSDGYLWVGTQRGALRFDGVKFVDWRELGEPPPSGTIYALFGDRAGNLWIGGSESLSRWRQGKWSVVMSGFRTNDILEDATGTIWLSRTRVRDGTGGLCSVQLGVPRCYNDKDGLPFNAANPVARDATGRIWVGGSTGAARWDGSRFDLFPRLPLHANPDLYGISAFAALPDGAMLVASVSAGKGLGVQRLKDNVWSDYQNASLNASGLEATKLLLDRDGSLWIGTTNDGVYHMHGERSDHYGSGDGLSSDSITSLFQDQEGNIWVTTPQGVDRFRDLRVTTLSAREGVATDWISSVTAAKDGGIWVGAWGALYRINGGKVTVIDKRAGLPGDMVTAMLETSDGQLWLGVDSELYRYDGARFHVIKKSDGSRIGAIVALAEDAPGSIVTAPTARGNITRLKNGSFVDSIAVPDGAQITNVALVDRHDLLLTLNSERMVRVRDGGLEPVMPGITAARNGFADGADSLWLAHRDGLLRWQRGKHRLLDASNGLPCNLLYSATRDRDGNVWLYSECGVIRVAESELQQWWADAAHRPTFEWLDSTSGAFAARNTFNPSSAVDQHGTVWFISELLVQFVDPGSRRSNPLPPPVHIERMVADDENIPLDAAVSLAPLTREIQIDYTALSFSVPQKVRFRYRLAGLEQDWHDAGNRRQVLYSNLPPGDYRFQVLAANNDGVWNTEGASLAFTVPPAYFQTLWFRLLCLLLIGLVVWLLVALRIRAVIREVQGRLAERLSERERIARELHDTLLQGFHGLMLRLQVAIDVIPKHQPARLAMEETLDRADVLLAESRERIRNLRYEGTTVPQLPEALASAGEDLRQQSPIEYSVTVEGAARDIDPIIRDEMYLIGREALTNAFRHSQAQLIEVEINFDNAAVRLRIRDDGKGIAEETLRGGGLAGHWGLSGMRERALKIGGDVKIWNRAGAGTEVELRVPAAVAYPRAVRPSSWASLRRRFGSRQ